MKKAVMNNTIGVVILLLLIPVVMATTVGDNANIVLCNNQVNITYEYQASINTLIANGCTLTIDDTSITFSTNNQNINVTANQLDNNAGSLLLQGNGGSITISINRNGIAPNTITYDGNPSTDTISTSSTPTSFSWTFTPSTGSGGGGNPVPSTPEGYAIIQAHDSTAIIGEEVVVTHEYNNTYTIALSGITTAWIDENNNGLADTDEPSCRYDAVVPSDSLLSGSCALTPVSVGSFILRSSFDPDGVDGVALSERTIKVEDGVVLPGVARDWLDDLQEFYDSNRRAVIITVGLVFGLLLLLWANKK